MSIQITPEQHIQIEQVIQRWMACGLSTAPADRAEAERGIYEAYAAAGHQPPQRIVWCNSPLQVDLTLAYLHLREWRQVWKRAKRVLPAEVWQCFGEYMLSSISETAADVLWDDIGNNLRDADRLLIFPERSPDTQVLWDDVLRSMEPLAASIEQNIGRALGSIWTGDLHTVFEDINWGDPLDNKEIDWWGSYGGQHVVSRLAAYECWLDVLGLPLVSAALARGVSRVARSAGMWWAFEKVCFVVDRPTVLHVDSAYRPHHASKPAVRYCDGWERYYWHGVQVPASVILSPDSISPQQIESEHNLETRRVMIERYGIERYLADSGAEEVDRDRYGVLYRKSFVDEEPLVMVKVTNHTPEPDGTFREFFIRVPPGIITAHHAVAWTFGMKKEDYHPCFES